METKSVSLSGRKLSPGLSVEYESIVACDTIRKHPVSYSTSAIAPASTVPTTTSMPLDPSSEATAPLPLPLELLVVLVLDAAEALALDDVFALAPVAVNVFT